MDAFPAPAVRMMMLTKEWKWYNFLVAEHLRFFL